MQRSDGVAQLWARSGAMALTGPSDGAPSVAPAALALYAERCAVAVAAVAARNGATLALDGPALLGERAACAGLARRGRTSAGGSAQLVRARDGWLAVNLPRADDLASVPAWLEIDAIDASDPWRAIERAVRDRGAADLVERARLLGLAIAPAGAPAPLARPGVQAIAAGEPSAQPARAPLVLDFSSLWAGPLCASLLAATGARVVKVESTARPDGARSGSAAFFDLMNAGKRSVALDWSSREGIDAMHALLDAADVVVESARPRAFEQLGVDAAAFVRARPGRIWVSITGYGRDAPMREWVAFGDDAACAAGLAVAAGRDLGEPCFCADAVADPLAGLRAAEAALAAWEAGGGALLDVSLCDVAAEALAAAPAPERATVSASMPRARRPAGAARPFGADTRAVLDEIATRSRARSR